MTFSFEIPGSMQSTPVTIEPGSSLVFVGANGAGKTRLAVYIEEAMGERAHRISAHRSLRLNPAVPKIPGEAALRKLRYGHENEGVTISNRLVFRWLDSQPATAMLDDFDSVIQALFADQSDTTLNTHRHARAGTLGQVKATKFETLSEIWQRLIPHRQLVISGDDIKVSAIGEPKGYPASDMSDGERSVFYLIAQALVAANGSLLIIDEPELHVHPSIMSSLWDEIETVRKDCAFLFITHDLHFAASRTAQKYVIKAFSSTRMWTIESVPEDSGFEEDVATLILGSRRPILFVEGTGKSLDIAIYRCCFPQWMVIPRGSCEQVVHAVVTMRANSQLTRVSCAGIVDADDYSEEDIQYLNQLRVFPLPVSEIENLILLPNVSSAIAQLEGFEGSELASRLAKLEEAIFSSLKNPNEIENVVVSYCRRRIDRVLKKIDLSASKNMTDLLDEYNNKTSDLDIKKIADDATQKINKALEGRDLLSLLTIYSNKGLLAYAAQYLKDTRRAPFESWLTRMLRDDVKAPALAKALKEVLPTVQAL